MAALFVLLICPCNFAVSATGNETQITSVKFMPMVDRPKLNFFSQGYHIMYSICWQNNHQGKESHQHVKKSKWYGLKVLLILLLLSGDIQMNPGPSTNQHITEPVSGSTECNPSWSVNCGAEISGPSGCKLGDVGCLAKLPLDILQDVPMLERPELCNSSVLDSESFGESKPSLICKQYNVLSGVKQTNKLQAPYENSKTKGAINHAAQKQKQFKLFQTVNHAIVIWDSKLKPKGILGGHLNIRSITSKRDQVEHLLMNSNLDFLALSETWLSTSTPTCMIDVSGYSCYRKDRPSRRGGE